MILVSAKQAGQQKFRVDSHGAGAWIHPYFGTGPQAIGTSKPQVGAPWPMLYLVQQDANTVIPTHFHQVDQFQVAVAGSGKLGAHALSPLTVHFSAAFTGYGPLAAHGLGLCYFTVRHRFDPGLRPLPEARGEMDAARACGTAKTPLNRVTDPLDLAWPLAVPAGGQSMPRTAETLLQASPGVHATLHTLGPHSSTAEALAGKARVWLVINGQGSVNGQDLQVHDGMFLGAGEAAEFVSGASGLQLLELAFGE